MNSEKKAEAMDKKKLLISFSGGETSAFMASLLWTHKQEEFEMVFVFANTGQEREETLEFIEECSKYFGFPVYWVEGVFSRKYGVGVKSRLVDFKKADRDGKVFEQMISVYGIPNVANPQCSRELKANVINHFARHVLLWKDFYLAIGIRSDEADRMNAKAKAKKIIYPLISNDFFPNITKQHVNYFWDKMPFRLRLKGYQGNCKWCWKKNIKKLEKIAFENPEVFEFPKLMEKKYGNFFTERRTEKWNAEGKELPRNIKFFRGGLGAEEILKNAKDHKIEDDHKITAFQTNVFDASDLDLVGGDSCEVWSDCK